MANRKTNHTHISVQQKDTDPILAEQKRLAKRVKKLYRRINRLKARHNELLPINRLPPELFTRIFLILQSNFDEQHGKNYYRWVAVTQVSKSWRNLALGTKQLWNAISHTTKADQSRWATVSYERSQPLSVDVIVDFDLTGHGHHFPFLGILSRQNDRMRREHIKVVGARIRRDTLLPLLDGLRQPAPVLEELKILGSDTISDLNTAPLHLFNSVAPSLRSIEITTFNLTFASLPFQTLTTLILRYQKGHHGVLPLHVLFDVLKTNSIHLYHLELQHALSEDDNYNQVANPTMIHLPSLWYIFLSLPAHQCARLLSHFVISPFCFTRIWGCRPTNHIVAPLINPQTFFDDTLTHFFNDPTEFIALDIDMKQGRTTFGLRREEDYSAEELTWADRVSLEIGVLPSARGDGDWLSLPSIAEFPKMWAVFLDGSPQGRTYPAAVELVSVLSSIRKICMSLSWL
ncbi:hypothetical protein BDN72DRAFT_915418 [Pluteus cervinus]|uniref:Uncharacterized protein n=1 Tax=Pluteus cervinus TaxID=181527 RepID=A0ACD3AMS9_9AGAR|nr:hypothetical protein BDN72DRAFT_915418 [Pluteus cervinus]